MQYSNENCIVMAIYYHLLIPGNELRSLFYASTKHEKKINYFHLSLGGIRTYNLPTSRPMLTHMIEQSKPPGLGQSLFH